MSSALLSKREPSPRPCLDGSTASTFKVPCRLAKKQVFIHLFSLHEFLSRVLCVGVYPGFEYSSQIRSATHRHRHSHMPDERKEDIPRTKEVVWAQPLPLQKGFTDASLFPLRQPPLGRERGACLESNKKILLRLGASARPVPLLRAPAAQTSDTNIFPPLPPPALPYPEKLPHISRRQRLWSPRDEASQAPTISCHRFHRADTPPPGSMWHAETSVGARDFKRVSVSSLIQGMLCANLQQT